MSGGSYNPAKNTMHVQMHDIVHIITKYKDGLSRRNSQAVENTSVFSHNLRTSNNFILLFE